MSTPAWLRRWQRESQQAWQRLAPRERRLVSVGGIVLALVLVWLMLFEPAWNTVQRWRAALPELNAQAAQLDTILAEVRELQRNQGHGLEVGPELTASLEDSLERAGLADRTTLAEPGAGTWTVTLDQAPVAATLTWLQTLPFELRLRASAIDLARAEGPDGRQLAGRLSGEITLSAGAEP